MIAKPSEHTNVHKITVPMHNTRGIITLFDSEIISCSLVQTSGKSKAVCFSSSAEESRYNSIYDGATDGGIRIVGLGRGQTFKAHCIAKKVRVYFNRRFQHMRFLQQIVYVQLLCVFYRVLRKSMQNGPP